MCFLLLVLPTLVVIVVSFTSGFSLKFPPPGYSLRWYAALLDAWQLHFAAEQQLQGGDLDHRCSPCCSASPRRSPSPARRRRPRACSIQLFMSPLMLPALAFGLASLMFFTLIGLPVSPLTLVIGHMVVCVPYVVRTTVAALAQLDPALLESSASLGASRLYTFRRVTLPLIRPGILAGAFIAFMSSFDNVPVSLFLRDARTDMLPIRMWQDLESKLDVTIAAVSGVMIAFTIVALLVMERVAGLSRRLPLSCRGRARSPMA